MLIRLKGWKSSNDIFVMAENVNYVDLRESYGTYGSTIHFKDGTYVASGDWPEDASNKINQALKNNIDM